MTNLKTTYFGMTGDLVMDSLTTGHAWSLGPSRTIDFSVSNGFDGEYWINPKQVVNSLDLALDVIESYVNVKFNYSGFFSNPQAAALAGSEINLSLSTSPLLFPNSSYWAIGFFPNTNIETSTYAGLAGDIYLNINSDANRLPSYAPGSAGWALLLHELGHTLGLKHPHDDGGTGRPTFNELGVNQLDLDVFSVMSYDDAAPWNLITWDPATPMILDVLALQAMYGKNLSTNAGHTNHQLRIDGTYSTIWDASGIDTISVADSNEAWVIDLPTMAWSTLVDTKVGSAVPVSQFTSYSPSTYRWLAGDFENVVGSRFNDQITANQFDNHIFGGQGNDLIDGGLGIDTVYYSGVIARYQGSVGVQTIVVDTQFNGDGRDTLINVERLQFSDISLALDVAPDQNAGSVYMLYKAAFNRAPDEGGMGYWLAQKDGGANIVTNIAQGFVNSSEFVGKYGINPSNSSYVNNLYLNVLGRSGEAEGVAYWTTQMNAGKVSKADALVQFATLPEGASLVANLIANGITYQEWGA